MRTRTPAGLAALAAGLLAVSTAAQPPGQPPKQPPVKPPAAPPPATTPAPTPSPLAGPPGPAHQQAWPKEVGGKTLPAWITELKESTDPAVRDAALRAIPLFGPDARKPALDPLLAALSKERDPGVRLNVIDLLGVIGAENADQAKRIAKALALVLANAGPGGPTRLHLVRAVANYGPDAADAVSAVLAVITDPAWETRRGAAFALGRLGFATDPKKGPSTAALKGLANTLLKDDSAAVRLEAVQALILLGPPAYKPDSPTDYAVVIRPYLDAVATRLKVEKDKGVQVWLLVLLMRYDGSQLTDANVLKVAGYVTDPDPAARYHALTALGMLGEKAKPAVPRIADALRFDEPELVYAALSALAALGEHARQALPELERLRAVSKDEALKAVVGEAIDVISGKKKPAPPPAAPAAPPKVP